jgi:hypothetical protein
LVSALFSLATMYATKELAQEIGINIDQIYSINVPLGYPAGDSNLEPRGHRAKSYWGN